MTFEQADSLFLKIREMFLESGGAYQTVSREVEHNILEALATRQFVIRIKGGKVRYFACYWMIKPEDVDDVKERIKPLDRVGGTVMYVAELANLDGSMKEIIGQLRRKHPHAKGVFWHRPVKKDRVFHFPSQKGASNGF